MGRREQEEEEKEETGIEEAIPPKWKTNELTALNKHYVLFPAHDEAMRKH